MSSLSPFFLLILILPQFSAAFNCLTCEGEDCLDPDRWMVQSCPPNVNLCYRLEANNKVFRRGCAPAECDKMYGIPTGAKCNTCDSEKCNGIRQAQVDRSGGGGVWSSSSSTASLTAVAVFLSLILAL